MDNCYLIIDVGEDNYNPLIVALNKDKAVELWQKYRDDGIVVIIKKIPCVGTKYERIELDG